MTQRTWEGQPPHCGGKVAGINNIWNTWARISYLASLSGRLKRLDSEKLSVPFILELPSLLLTSIFISGKNPGV